MMSVRRMKIKAAPNIMGGIGKKANTTNISFNKDSLLISSSVSQVFNSNNDSMNISTVSCNNEENYSLMKRDGASPVSGNENASNSKEADGILEDNFCQIIPSSDKCQLININKEDYTTSSKGSIPGTKQPDKLQLGLDLTRRKKIKTAPNIINGTGIKVNPLKSTGLSNNSLGLSSIPQESGSNIRSLSTSTLAEDDYKENSSRSDQDCEIVNASVDNDVTITYDGNLSSQISSTDSCKVSTCETEMENLKTSYKVSHPVPELNTVLQQDLDVTKSTFGFESVSVSSSSVNTSNFQQGYNMKRSQNKCTKPNIISKPIRKPQNLRKTNERNSRKTIERNSLKENINHVGIEGIDDSFSVPSNFNSRLKGKKKSKEKYFFKERKLQYKQKMKSTNGNLEVNEMPLFYLIFHNPSTNPMAQQRQNERDRRNSISSNAGSIGNETRSSRANKAIEADGITSETLEELRVEEEGLQIINDEEYINLPESNDEGSNKSKDSLENENNDEEDSPNVLAPQVKLGPDGNLIIDEKSLLIQTTAAKNRDKILNNSEVVEENEESSHYGKWSKRRKRATEWTKKETARFYKALSTVGTDFSVMSTVFAWRTRAELKIKFKKEERNNPHLVDIALNDCTQFDFSIFDESDYDPEEDRKESKEAEKAEAKKRKELELQKRQEERNEERQKKKDQICADKKRKKRLRELCNSGYRRKKPKVEIPLNIQEDSNESTALSVVIEPQEVICEVVFSCRNSVIENDDQAVTTKTSERKKTCVPNEEHSPLPHDSNDGEEYQEILTSKARVNSVSSGNYLNHLGINVFKEYNNCSNIGLKELRDQDALIVPIEDSPVDVMDASSEAVIESVVSANEKVDDITSITSGTTISGTEISDQSLHTLPAMAQIILPISSVKKNPDGSQYVEIDTAKGLRKIEPVPAIPPSTSNIIIVFSQDPSASGEQVFHVYFISPVTSSELEHVEPSSKSASSL